MVKHPSGYATDSNVLDDLVCTIKEYVNKNQSLGRCKCIIFTGSRTLGDNHAVSDWSFYVVHDREPITIPGIQLHREVITYKDERVDLFCVSGGLTITHSKGWHSRDWAGLHMLVEGEVKFCAEDYRAQLEEIMQTATKSLGGSPPMPCKTNSKNLPNSVVE